MMVKKKVQITNKSSEFNNPEDIHLSIQISLDGFSFCTINTITNEISTLIHYPFSNNSPTPIKHLQNVKGVFEKELLLQKQYQSVNVSHVNNLSSFVPKALFNDENLPDYLKYGHKIFKNDYIVYDSIDNHELVNVYIPFVNINNFLIDKFGSFDYKHFSTILIKNLLDTYKFSERPHMFVMVNETHFEIIAIANNSFQLYNSFTYQNKEDLIYYILFTAEQLHFNTNYFELIFLGETVKNDEIYDITYKYVRNVSFLENRYKYNLNKEFTDDIQRKFFTLLHQF